ncbi:hypothetical protein E4U43_001042 [Claviceps pusilla]|uniref:Dolichyl-diphosphooligosaccharide--protein glycosyltransferase subunit 4 n=1 Tax=Claviceps pusilla TaxID=123648 RepID=A0A9P7N8Z5_9HYPO|nr:hypothetical protein E4U43_001042 [Claviceps pusilla]
MGNVPNSNVAEEKESSTVIPSLLCHLALKAVGTVGPSDGSRVTAGRQVSSAVQSRSRLLLRNPLLPQSTVIMITDRDLFTLAVFFGIVSMLLIVVYHLMETNALPDAAGAKKADHAKAS